MRTARGSGFSDCAKSDHVADISKMIKISVFISIELKCFVEVLHSFFSRQARQFLKVRNGP